MLNNSAFFYTFITLAFYLICVFIQKKLRQTWFNPLLMSIVFTVIMLLAGNVKYEVYEENTKLIGYFLTPATACLAVPLYEKLGELKKNALAIFAGIFSGVMTSALCIGAIVLIFKLDESLLASFLPKSITTAIGVGMAEELGGIAALTAISIIITGIVGNILAEIVCKIFKITDPVAIGAAIGTSSHAGGTAKAIQLGQTEGAISGLAIAVAGIMTVVIAPVFMKLFT